MGVFVGGCNGDDDIGDEEGDVIDDDESEES